MMSSPLIQEALRKQEISWGIEEVLTREVDKNSDVRKNDEKFARLERMLLEGLKEARSVRAYTDLAASQRMLSRAADARYNSGDSSTGR